MRELSSYLNTLHEWLEEHDLELSPGKSTATVFTTFNQEMSMSLPIKIGQHTVPTTKNPKILGVTLDSLHTFNAHSNNTLNKTLEAELRAEGSCWFELGKRQGTPHNDLKGHLTACCQLCRPNLDTSTS